MQRQTISPFATRAWIDAALGDFVGALTDPVHVHLFTAGPGSLSPEMIVGDFTEAAFSGYLIQNIAAAALIGPVVSENGNAECVAASCNFTSASIAGPGETILGYYLTDTANSLLYYAEVFQDAVLVVGPPVIIDLLIVIPVFLAGSVA